MVPHQVEAMDSGSERRRTTSQSDEQDSHNSSTDAQNSSSNDEESGRGRGHSDEPEGAGDETERSRDHSPLPSYEQTLSNPAPLYESRDGPSRPLQSSHYDVRELKVVDRFPFNLSIRATDAEATTYFVHNSLMMPKRPDIRIHSGDNKTGPVLGVGHLSFFGSDNTFGIGDPATDDTMMWEKLARTSKWTHADYGFELSVGGGQRAKFSWTRTKHRPFNDQDDLKLVDVDRPYIILAEYRGTCQDRFKRGRILIRRGLGPKWEVTVILTAMMVVEMARRRSRQRMNEEVRGLIYG